MKKSLLFIFLCFLTNAFAQTDCSSAISVCGSSGINYSPVGIGNINEPLGGCLTTGEHNSVWYKITIATGGTLTFDLLPTDPGADYDWAIYGPNKTCGNLGSPIRCNAATVEFGVGPNTGMNMTSTILSGAGGSLTPYCRYMDVLAGETYYLYLDNWISNTNPTMAPFSLTWGGTATIASPFTDTTLTPNPFIAPGSPGANPNDPREVTVCENPIIFNMASLTPGILNGNNSYVVTYHYTANEAITISNPILAPINIDFTKVYYYTIRYNDTLNPNNVLNTCTQIGEFKFKDGSVKTNTVTLTECSNNGEGKAWYDLTTANVYTGTLSVTKKYYPTIAALNSGTMEIINPTAYESAEGEVYVKVISPTGCFGIAKIVLKFRPTFTATDGSIAVCSINGNPSLGIFDLNDATIVATASGTSKKYYPSLLDAQNDSNIINPVNAYTSPNGIVYVRVTNGQGCYVISKITLTVNPPVYSSILKDKVMCIEGRETLDAGPGFDSYLWSTGATTSSITGVSVGTYWVKLKTGDCVATQEVKVYPTEQPVVQSIEVGFKTIKVNVVGGTPAYQYSIDNINWQASNEFNNIPRGDVKVYVKDAMNCNPIIIPVTIPNIINTITSNGDGLNDGVDYSALAYKKNVEFVVYSRYGDKVYQSDIKRGFKWDGSTIAGKKLSSDTYWYTLTWTEDDAAKTKMVYSGWLLLKNR